jgi:hypothetical protein
LRDDSLVEAIAGLEGRTGMMTVWMDMLMDDGRDMPMAIAETTCTYTYTTHESEVNMYE